MDGRSAVDAAARVVDAEACVGCGACEHVCPARPLPTMAVNGLHVQRQVAPMGESDLLGEMRRLIDGGAALVVAKDGVIVRQVEGTLQGVIVASRIVEHADAEAFVAGGVKKVMALTMSEDARALLADHGIPTETVKTT